MAAASIASATGARKRLRRCGRGVAGSCDRSLRIGRDGVPAMDYGRADTGRVCRERATPRVRGSCAGSHHQSGRQPRQAAAGRSRTAAGEAAIRVGGKLVGTDAGASAKRDSSGRGQLRPRPALPRASARWPHPRRRWGRPGQAKPAPRRPDVQGEGGDSGRDRGCVNGEHLGTVRTVLERCQRRQARTATRPSCSLRDRPA